MKQQSWKQLYRPAPTVYSRPIRVMIVGFLAILVFGIGNTICSVKHRPA